jgi:hypothetical protein
MRKQSDTLQVAIQHIQRAMNMAAGSDAIAAMAIIMRGFGLAAIEILEQARDETLREEERKDCIICHNCNDEPAICPECERCSSCCDCKQEKD